MHSGSEKKGLGKEKLKIYRLFPNQKKGPGSFLQRIEILFLEKLRSVHPNK
jgi:hypothetical protein